MELNARRRSGDVGSPTGYCLPRMIAPAGSRPDRGGDHRPGRGSLTFIPRVRCAPARRGHLVTPTCEMPHQLLKIQIFIQNGV